VFAASPIALLGGLVTAALIFGAGGTERVLARQTQPASSANEHVEGDWVRTDTNGSGDFGGLANTFEKAQLTTEGAAMASGGARGPRGAAFTENRVHAVGDPYIVVDQPCGAGAGFSGGALGVNPDSGAIHIVEQKDEVIVAPERGGSRRIYMDGRAHPDLSLWTPSASGHSVGHYENGVLVVDTIGLTRGGVTAGGYRTPETHLSERFEVSPDGKHLTIKYTYSDPKIYVKPHSYQYTFDRLPEGSTALEDWCDASDPIEKQSIVPPPQQ
jgi:hypothetical protein